MVAIFICLACLLFSSCDYGAEQALYRPSPVNTRASSLHELDASQNPSVTNDIYTVAVFADIHFGKPDGKRYEDSFLTWLQQIKAEGKCPAFCICLGDIADHGRETEYAEYKAFTKKIEDILDNGGKVYGVLGNHDLYNNGWQHYQQYVFPYESFYHFETKNFSWYTIDSASGSLGINQYNILKNTLQNDPRPKIILTHIPVFGDPLNNMGYFTFQNSYESDMMITLCVKNNVKLMLNGHTHRPNKNYFKECMELTVTSITKDNKWTVITIDETNGTIKEEYITN